MAITLEESGSDGSRNIPINRHSNNNAVRASSTPLFHEHFCLSPCDNAKRDITAVVILADHGVRRVLAAGFLDLDIGLDRGGRGGSDGEEGVHFDWLGRANGGSTAK